VAVARDRGDVHCKKMQSRARPGAEWRETAYPYLLLTDSECGLPLDDRSETHTAEQMLSLVVRPGRSQG
jgi:hypothetical protein